MQYQTNKRTRRANKYRLRKNFDCRIKRVVILVFLCVMFCYNKGNADSIKCDELEDLLRERTHQMLMEHVDKKSEAIQERVNVFATRIGELTEKLPTRKLDAELATWIEESLMELMEHRVNALLSEREKSEDPLQGVIDQAERVFPKLDRSTARALIDRRQKLIELNDGYWEKVHRFLIKQISKFKKIKLKLSPFPQKDSFFKKIADLKKKEEGATRSNHEIAANFNMEIESIDRKLLTMALRREIAIEIRRQAVWSHFSTTNIFFLSFDPGGQFGKAKPKKFQEVKHTLDETLEDVFTKSDEVAIFRMDKMSWFISRAEYIQWGQEFELPNKMPECKRSVQWNNSPEFWKMGFSNGKSSNSNISQ